MKKLSLLLFMALFALASCSDREIGGGGHTGPQEGNAEVDMTFFKSSTRALPTEAEMKEGTPEEKQINSMDLFLFKEGNFICRRPAKPGSTSVDNKNFRATVPAGTGYDVCFLANSRDLIDGLVADGTLLNDTTDTWKPTRAEIMALLVDGDAIRFADTADGAATVDNSANRSDLPMFGERTNADIKKDDVTNWSSVNLMRTVASVDVYCAQEVDNFVFDDAYLYFAPDKGSIMPLGTYNIDNNEAESKSVAGMKTVHKFGPVVADNNESVAHQFYLFENDTEKASYNEPDRRYTRLVVGGKYKGTTYYYPIDFIVKLKDSNDKDSLAYDKISRNKKYFFLIRKVTGPGYPDPDTASEEPPININSDVLDWDLNDGDNVIFDGTYYVSVGKDAAVIAPSEGSFDIVDMVTNAGPDEVILSFLPKLDENGDPLLDGNGDPITNGDTVPYIDPVTGEETGIQNDRFIVEKIIGKDDEGNDVLVGIKATAKGDYDPNDPEKNKDIVGIQIGNIKIKIPIYQTDGGRPWEKGDDFEVGLGK